MSKRRAAPAEKGKLKIYFILTVDVEEEWDWSEGFPVSSFSVNNTRKIPEFQNFCSKLGIRPTYFIDYVVISDKKSSELFNDINKDAACEMGAHIHSWCNPPIEEKISYRNSYIVNLPLDLLKRKIINLTNRFEEKFNKRPISFRSGRWSMNGKILKMIADLGYRVDSCVFPFYADSTFSYHYAPTYPYWPDYNDINKKGSQRDIFEIPVTSGFNHKSFNLCNKIFQFLSSKQIARFRIIGMLYRFKMLEKIQLSPELHGFSEMKSLIKASLKRGDRVLNMFLHSSSLIPRGSPYASTESDIKEILHRVEAVSSYLKRNHDVYFCTISEAKEKILREVSL